MADEVDDQVCDEEDYGSLLKPPSYLAGYSNFDLGASHDTN